nr:unnamed protein product [Callosobruchus analis]
MRVLQVNAMRSRNSHDAAYAVALEKGADIDRAVGGSKTEDVAVIFLNKNVGVAKVRSEEGYVCIYLKNFCMFCCYSSPNMPIDTFEKQINTIMVDSKNVTLESINLEDLNVKSPQWGAPVADARGNYFTEWLATLDMIVLNTGLTPTFVRGDCHSYIDVTCSTQKIAKQIKDWQVLDEESLSDHRLIYFEIDIGSRSKTKWKRKKARIDWAIFDHF